MLYIRSRIKPEQPKMLIESLMRQVRCAHFVVGEDIKLCSYPPIIQQFQKMSNVGKECFLFIYNIFSYQTSINQPLIPKKDIS